MSSLMFVFRLTFAWCVFFVLLMMVWSGMLNAPEWPVVVLAAVMLIFVVTGGFSHVQRVRMVAGSARPDQLRNRHRRQIELPASGNEAFDVVDASIRDVQHVDEVAAMRDSLRITAKVKRINPYGGNTDPSRYDLIAHVDRWLGGKRDQVFATIVPNGATSTVTIVCEPESPAWTDWLRADHGRNLETADTILRSITRRVSERRGAEQSAAHDTATAKEISEAKLSLLHAQVEPHFLYNTLASAQLLTRSDPVRADEMLGHLIDYLRRSLPRTLQGQSTLGEELERARSYLEIMKVRMGARLATQIDVPSALLDVPFPAMMLQTLVENAIKHGLEPKTGGGTVWILAKANDREVAVTVADDGRGFSNEGAGTGIGLKNVRERLRLAYGALATFNIVANFPNGVAATITVPASPASAGMPNTAAQGGFHA